MNLTIFGPAINLVEPHLLVLYISCLGVILSTLELQALYSCTYVAIKRDRLLYSFFILTIANFK